MEPTRCSIGWVRAGLLGGALLASCSDAHSESSAPPPLQELQAALSDDVWITTSRDSIELTRWAIGAAAQRMERRDGPPERDEVALRVPRAALADISEAQHREHHRCGGFILQETEAEAMATLAAPDVASERLYAPPYTVDNAATVDKLLPEAKEANVLATIRKLSAFRTRFHTSPTGEEAAMYIRDAWKALGTGRDDITVELVEHEKTPQPSIKLTIRGTSSPNEIVVLGGHMDSISGRGSNTALAPGADDNASGIAVLTEVVRAAVALNYRPARTVVVYGYAAEEIGLVGSAEIAAKAKADKLNIAGVLQLDMTNFTSAPMPYIGLLTDFVDPVLNEFSIKLIEQYVKLPYKQFKCGYGCSDHASWNRNGFPATSPHEADMNQANGDIHTTNDTLALSKDSAAHSMHFVRFGLAFMAELAKGKLEAPANPLACDASKPCAPGLRCDNGTCVPEADAGPSGAGQCTTNAECPTGQVCQGGRCSAPNPPAAACSASVPCATGLTCVAGACVAPSGPGAPVNSPDAGAGQPDAGAGVRVDGGAQLPPTTTDMNPSVTPGPGGQAEDTDSAGCSVRSAGSTRSSAWLPWVAALVLGARLRRRRQR